MKLIKFSTNLTDKEVNDKVDQLPMIEKEFIYKLSLEIDYLDVKDKFGKLGMFAIVDDWYVNKIDGFYKNLGIKYTTVDLTKDAFMSNPIDICYSNDEDKDISKDIDILINKFKEDFTDVDVVLDKILEKGIESLTEFDKSFLG